MPFPRDLQTIMIASLFKWTLRIHFRCLRWKKLPFSILHHMDIILVSFKNKVHRSETNIYTNTVFSK